MIDIFRDDVLDAAQPVKPTAAKILVKSSAKTSEPDAENAHPNQSEANKAKGKGEKFTKPNEWEQWYKEEFKQELQPPKESGSSTTSVAETGGPTATVPATSEGSDNGSKNESVAPREWDAWYAETFNNGAGGSDEGSDAPVPSEVEQLQKTMEQIVALDDDSYDDEEDEELAELDAASELRASMGALQVPIGSRTANPVAHDFMEGEVKDFDEPMEFSEKTNDDEPVTAPLAKKSTKKPLTRPQAPDLATSKRGIGRRGGSAFGRIQQQPAQFKAKPAPDFSQTGAPVCMRSVSATIPRSPKLSTKGRKRGFGVLSTEEQELQHMQANQFKAKAIGEGVVTRSTGRKPLSRSQPKMQLTTPVEPVFSTASRRRASSVLSTEEQELQHMQANQFKAKAIGEGVVTRSKRRKVVSQPKMQLTTPVEPVFSTASRRRASSVLSTEEQELQHMQANQFKAKAIGEGVATRVASSRAAAPTKGLTVARAPKLSTASRRRGASVLSTEEQEELYMQTHQFHSKSSRR